MFCPEFKQKGYLYLSRELTPIERKLFKSHLRVCQSCREELASVKQTFGMLEQLPMNGPCTKIRDSIIMKSKSKKNDSLFMQKLKSLLFLRTDHPVLTWGLSTAVAAVVLIFLLLRPFGHVISTDIVDQKVYQWNDNFFIETELLDQKIDLLESGELFTVSYILEDGELDLIDNASTVIDDLNNIDNEIETLIGLFYELRLESEGKNGI